MMAAMRERHVPAVRAQIAQQPPHQPRVVGLAEDLLVVAHDAASSSSSSCLRWSSA